MIPTSVAGAGASIATDVLLMLGGVVLKGSAILGVCAAATQLMRRSSAASRHLVWTIGVAGALLVPALAVVLPAWRIAVPESVTAMVRSMPPLSRTHEIAVIPQSAGDEAALEAMFSTAASGAANEPVLINEETGAAVQFKLDSAPGARAGASWPAIVLMVWVAGIVVALSSLLASMLRVRRIQSHTVRVETGPCVSAVVRASARIGLTRVPRLHVGDERMMPMVWGLFRPVLLLPAGAACWSNAKLESVLLHELAHIHRRDPLTQFMAEIARAVYWFNPLIWLAAKELYMEREHACDDIVLTSGTRASDYAGELLDLVRSLRSTRATTMAAIAMARPSQLKMRLSAVLDEARPRRAVSRGFAALAGAIAAIFVLPVAALQPFASVRAEDDLPILSHLGRSNPKVVGLSWRKAPVTSAEEQKRAPRSAPEQAVHSGYTTSIAAAAVVTSKTPRPSAPITSAPVTRAHPAAAATAQTQQGMCWQPNQKNTSLSHHQDTDDQIEIIKWSSARCSGAVRIEGRVRFNDAFTGIESISSGGLFRLEEDNDGDERRLTVRNNGGQLAYDYRVDGREREFDAAGRAWLGEALLSLVRSTGFHAAERVDQLLRTQGPQGVLNEVKNLRADYARQVYLTKLLERTDLTPGMVKAAVDIAAQDISGDYARGQVLMALAKRYKFDDATRQSLIQGATSMSSDYEKRRVLSAALANDQLSTQDVTAMLRAAQTIKSDYERSQLLMGVTQRYKLQPGMRQAYLEAASGISSDYEKRRVYQNLLKQGALAPAELATMLTYAAGIRSDYEKSQVLLELSQYDLSDPNLQRAYLAATTNMTSDYEHRRVLTSLLTKDQVSSANLDVVLKSAAGISSDYELSQVLMLIATKHTLNEQQKDAFMKALDSIASTHEHGRVASALLRKQTR